MKAHRTDPLSLAFGMLFLIVSLAYLADQQFNIDLPDMGIFIAIAVAVLGMVIAVTALFPHRKTAQVEPESSQEQAEVDENP